MEFGKWVLNLRKEHELDVRSFASKTGVDASTISRIENLRTKATIYTTFRICEGMQISLSELFSALNPDMLPMLEKQKSGAGAHVFSLSDLKTKIKIFQQNKEEAVDAITKSLNDLQKKFDFSNKDFHFTYDETLLLAEYKLRPYSAGEVDRMLFSSPLSSLYQINYPPLKANEIKTIYGQDGALMLSDVEAYLKNIHTKYRWSIPTAGRASGEASIERIKLEDVFKIDREAEQAGTLLGMFWEACRFYATFNSSHHVGTAQISLFKDEYEQREDHEPWEIHLATLYLVISRWQQISKRADVMIFGL